VRELQNVIERAVILCSDGECLEVEDLGLPKSREISDSVNLQHVKAPVDSLAEPNGEFLTLNHLEKRHIFVALERCKGNRTHAAKLLDISIRTLRNKLNEYSGKRNGSAGVEEAEERPSLSP
jgi:DNA-binding NtrC family response regulator